MYTEIKTFEDACEKLGISKELPIVSMLPESEQKQVEAQYKMTTICKALNLAHLGYEFKPDWNDYSQYKWYPWFDMDNNKDSVSGSGFSFYDCYCDDSDSYVGSRLCYAIRELAEYAGNQFLEIYKELYVIS